MLDPRHRIHALLLFAVIAMPTAAIAETPHLDPEQDLSTEDAARLMIGHQRFSAWNLLGAGFRTVKMLKVAYPRDGKWVLVPVDELRKTDTDGGEDAIVVAPGTYYAQVSCSGGGGGLLFAAAGRRNSIPVRVEAGYDYRFVCSGRSLSNVWVDVLVQPRAGQALRPTPARDGTNASWMPPSRPYMDVPRRTLTLPVAVEDARVVAAATAALQGRGWQVTEAHGSWVRGTLDRGDVRLVVDMVRIGESLQIVHVDSTGLDYGAHDGVASIDGSYFGWTNYLLHDMAKALEVPSPIE